MYADTDRPIKLTTPLGRNALLLISLTGREAISEMFRFELETVWQQDSPLKLDKLLGQKVTVEIIQANQTRYVNGIVNSIAQGVRDREGSVTHYRVEVVPALWLLTRKARSRIFQNKTVPDIVSQVLKEQGATANVVLKLTGQYHAREYCVQYRETDFAFISRLMEDEGIFYFFEHAADKHTMVLADSNPSFAELPGGGDVEFEGVIGGVRDDTRIFSWVKEQEIRSGKFSVNDWNFETPSTSLLADAQSAVTVAGNDQLEIYEHPGGYDAKPDGQTLAKTRIQEESAPGVLVHGESVNHRFCPAYTFNLKRHFADDSRYVLTSVEHSAELPLEFGRREADAWRYQNRFQCIPSEVRFRPQRVTPDPSVHGAQTAIVVGPAGEEIFTDKYGRVKVQFHWDREGKRDINSSCWIRVGTLWAGKGWGVVHIPRIGQEVIVDFLEGDVDRPIIVGSVYNAETMPPYALPANKTQSGIKSRSSKSGGTDNFNEIRLEDKKGSEQVFIHAEKNQDIEVENDETHWVGHDRKKTIDHDETVHVKHDRTETVDNNETITIHGKQDRTIDGDQSTVVTKGNQSIELQMGNQTTKIDLGKIETSAMQSIELKVGPSSIKLDPTGITIKGLMITVDASVQGVFKSVMTQVQGSAMTQVQGAVVMIN